MKRAAMASPDHTKANGGPCPYPLKSCPTHGTSGPYGKGGGIIENPNAGGYPDWMRETRLLKEVSQ